MGIKTRKNFRFTDALDELLPTAALMREAGEELAVKITNRTLAGVDENGQPFAPYAGGATKYGRTTPDLHDTDQMLADFGVVEASKRRFRLGFRTARSRKLASLHTTGTATMPARKFTGVQPSMIDAVVRTVFRRRR